MEWLEVAEYCSGFEKKYAAAARFAAEALAADRDLYDQWDKVRRYAGWSIQAAAGQGADASDLTADERARLRRQSLRWLREANSRTRKELLMLVGHKVTDNPDFACVREPAELAKLTPDERGEWEKFWAEMRPKPREVAPPPRPRGAPAPPP